MQVSGRQDGDDQRSLLVVVSHHTALFFFFSFTCTMNTGGQKTKIFEGLGTVFFSWQCNATVLELKMLLSTEDTPFFDTLDRIYYRIDLLHSNQFTFDSLSSFCSKCAPSSVTFLPPL